MTATTEALGFPWPFKSPPLRSWEHAGLLCATAKGALYGVNGYVRIPEDHPLHGVPYDDLDVEAPGGLTYGCYAYEAIGVLPARKVTTTNTLGWVGFDTQHAWDVWTSDELAKLGQTSEYADLVEWHNPRYWTPELVEEATARLAEQLAALSADPVGVPRG